MNWDSMSELSLGAIVLIICLKMIFAFLKEWKTLNPPIPNGNNRVEEGIKELLVRMQDDAKEFRASVLTILQAQTILLEKLGMQLSFHMEESRRMAEGIQASVKDNNGNTQ